MDLLTTPNEQAKRHAAVFVDKEDGKDRLLIVCYGGHGNREGSDRLLLSGCQLANAPPAGGRLYEQIDWAEVEIVLNRAEGDVLVVHDCCDAGVLFPRERIPHPEARRKFQYIAACKDRQRTRTAGLGSFTSSMIWVLKHRENSSGLTTWQSVASLSGYEHYPYETQNSFDFSGKFGLVKEDIWIAPATNFLDFRFHFAKHASESDIKAITDHLQAFLQTKEDLRFHKISFLGRKPYIAGPGSEEGRELAK
jgi:hypothetical protein